MNTTRTTIRRKLSDRLRSLPRDRRGTIIIITALMFPALLAFMALALDVGYIYDVKRNQQKAADSAAMGAGQEIWRQNTAKVVPAAKADATKNGFNDSDSAVTVTVEYPYSFNGGNANDSVRVLIEEVVPTYFARAFGKEAVTVRSQAVSGLVAYGNGCYFLLNPSAKSAFKSVGGSILKADCNVLINSTDDDGYFQNGGGQVCVPFVGVVGGFQNNPTCTEPGGPYPTSTTGIPQVQDPLANFLTSPPPVTDYGSVTIGNDDDEDLWPGYYTQIKQTGGISRLNEGLYYVDGEFTINGGTMTSLGDGVTIYVTDGNRVTVNGNAGTGGGGALPGAATNFGLPPTIAAAGGESFGAANGPPPPPPPPPPGTDPTVTLHAPVLGTNGSVPGMLFWSTSTLTQKTAGSAQSIFKGTLYFPNALLAFRGTNDSQSWQMVVADTAEHVGESTSVNDFKGNFPGMPPVRKVTLLQ